MKIVFFRIFPLIVWWFGEEILIFFNFTLIPVQKNIFNFQSNIFWLIGINDRDFRKMRQNRYKYYNTELFREIGGNFGILE